MKIVVNFLVGLIAIQHIAFLVLEMFLWTKPIGRKIFRTTPEFAAESASLAANQGLYNGFLAAGLIWSFFAPESFNGSLKIFFLGCVITAGLYGGYSVSKNIYFIQALPATLTLAFLLYKT